MAFGALAGSVWGLWERRSQDPWLRLLGRARRRLADEGIALPPSAGPRQMAYAATARHGERAQALAAWLVVLYHIRLSLADLWALPMLAVLLAVSV